jgi:glycosyltransferase involved in cell wall biosynthesis
MARHQIKISVVIPAYNAARSLGSTLESVFAQTRPADEILVVDDASTDNTTELVERCGDRVRLLRQARNQGPAAARNRAVAEANGDLIAFLDADDLWTLDKLAAAEQVFSNHPEVAFVFTDITDQDTATGHEQPLNRPENVAAFLNDFQHEREGDLCIFTESIVTGLLLKNIIYTPTVILKREFFHQLQGFPEEYRYAEDFQLWLKAAASGILAFINRSCCTRRLHGGNVTGNRLPLDTVQYRVLGSWAERRLAWKPGRKRAFRKRLSTLAYSLARRHAGRGEYRLARRYYRKSLHHHVNTRAAAGWLCAAAGISPHIS